MASLAIIFVYNCVVASGAILLHYEVLIRSGILLRRMNVKSRWRVLIGICFAFFAHVVEIWLFAFAFFILVQGREFGSFSGAFDGSLLDCCYISFTTYTSLGIGDIEPHGDIRFLVGIEALVGLVLIAWTASFLFLQMERFWGGARSRLRTSRSGD